MTDTSSHKDDGYRALGRFITLFSEMVREMRQRIEWHIRRPTDPPLVAELVFGGATADQISNVFFGMCRILMEHDEAEAAAATKLRRAVRDGDGVIPFRNRLAHGDWHIGYWSTTGLSDGGSTQPVPVGPTLIVIKALRADGAMEVIEPNLDERSDNVERLTKLLREYGAVCFGVHGRQRAGQELRVSDVLILDDGNLALGPKAVR